MVKKAKIVEVKSRASNKIAITFEEADLTYMRKKAAGEGTSVAAFVRAVVAKHVERAKAATAGAKTRRSVV